MVKNFFNEFKRSFDKITHSVDNTINDIEDIVERSFLKPQKKPSLLRPIASIKPLDILNPSKILESIGKGVEDTIGDIGDAIDDIGDTIQSVTQSPLQWLAQELQGKHKNPIRFLPEGVDFGKLTEYQLGAIAVLMTGGMGGTALAGLLAEEGIVGAGVELGGVAGIGAGGVAGLSQTIGNVLSTVGKIGGAISGLELVIESLKKAVKADDNSDKIDNLKDAIEHASKLAEENAGIEIKEMDMVLKALSGLGEIVRQSEEAAHSDIKEIIKENQGEISAIRHSEVVLDKDLQELKNEEKDEIDSLTRIATTLDKPTNIEDFLKDLAKFETAKAKKEYVIENYSVFLTLPNKEEILNIIS